MKTNSLKSLLVIVLMVFVTGIFAQEQKLELNALLPIDKDVLIGKLENGLTYYIRKNETPANRAELTLAVNAGAVLEDEDQRGLAHFCEHMAFNGSKHYPKNELVNYLESIGMKFGPEINAYTSFDETVYGIKVPLDTMEFLDKGLLVLYDWAFELSLDGEEIDKERGVIHEEWRGGQGANDRMMKKTLPVMLHNSQYAERLPIGLMSVVDSCEHDVLRRFYNDWYRPDLMAVIVVGDIDPVAVEQKIKDLFSQEPKAVNPRQKPNFEIPNHDETLVSIATDPEAQYSVAQVMYKHPLTIQKTVNDYRQSIVHNLYNSMINKRLAELTLKEDAPFIQGFSAYSGFLGPKSAYMSVAVTKNGELEKGLDAVLTENERVKQFGFTQTELDREKKSLMKNMDKAYKERNKRKSADFVKEYTSNFTMSQEPIPGIEFEYEMYTKFTPGITLEEINKLAAQWITDKNQVVIINAPEKEGVKVPTEDEVMKVISGVSMKKIEAYVDKVSNKPLMATLPTPSKVDKKSKNKEFGTEEWTLKNGVKVVLKSTDFKEDEILMSAYSVGGTSLYEVKDYVSAKIAAEVIQNAGIGELDKIELEKMLSDKSVSVTPWIGELQEGFSGRSSKEDLETMLKLTHLYFTSPRKDKSAYESYMARNKAALENNSLSPESVFRDSIKCVMSQNSPYKRPMTSELLDEASYNKVYYIYKERFGDASNFTFYFVGNFDSKEIKPLIEMYLGGLPAVKRTETWKDLNVSAPSGVVIKDVKKGTDPKSTVYMNFHGEMNYTVEDRIKLDVVSKVLSTKLLESIREDEGGVYSIGAYPGSYHYPDAKYGVTVYFGCAPENVDKLSKIVLEQMAKLKADGPTKVDLEKVIEKELRERETSIKENKFWLRQLKSADFHNEDLEQINKFNEYVKTLTIEDVKAAANKYFNEKNYVQVTLNPEN